MTTRDEEAAMSATPDRDALMEILASVSTYGRYPGPRDFADAVIAAGWQPPTEPTAEDEADHDGECSCGRDDRTDPHTFAPGCGAWEDDEPTAERAGDADDVAAFTCPHCGYEVRVPDRVLTAQGTADYQRGQTYGRAEEWATKAVCDRHWREVNPGREPHRLRLPESEWEPCCYCGTPGNIYVRVDLSRVTPPDGPRCHPVGGIHALWCPDRAALGTTEAAGS